MSVLDELQRRNVLRVVFAYLVVGWLFTEVLTTILPELGAPAWASRTVILVFALGFIPVAVLSWIYEFTPEGIKRESEIGDNDGARGGHRTFDYLVISAITILVLTIAVLGARSTIDESPSAGSVSVASVAVLPFVNMTGDARNDYFSDGMTETLLHMLTQIPDLQVAARTSSFAFKDQTRTAREIADVLGVAHILEGSVQLANNRVRVTAQLIRAVDGFHVWSQNYDREFDDIFRIQDEIAREVGKSLSASLLGSETTPDIVPVGTENPDAYDLYLQALGERATYSYRGLQAAESLLKGALATDPDFLDAKTELAINYMHQANTGLMGREEAITLCSAMTRQVLDVKPDDALANAINIFGDVLGHTELTGPEQTRAAIDELTRLTAENPDIYEIRMLLSDLLRILRQYDRALLVNLEGLQREPFNARIHYELGTLYSLMDRPEDARNALTKSLEIEPRQPNAYMHLARVSARTGDTVDIVRYMLKAFELDPSDHELPGALAMFLYDLRLVEEGDDFRDLVDAIAPTSDMSYQLALRRTIATDDAAESVEVAKRIVEEDVGERQAVFSEAVQVLMNSAAAEGTVSEMTAYIEQHAPGVFDTGAESLPPKYRAAQIAAFDAWYVALPRDEMLARLGDIIDSARDFGFDPMDDPFARLDIHALRGETEQGVNVALNDVLSRAVTADLRWRERFSGVQYRDIVAEPRVTEALERWQAEYEEAREAVRAYLAELSA
jgi:TolB-like protein/cytochrome c-type biogenesis protein CcmH/NrfG